LKESRRFYNRPCVSIVSAGHVIKGTMRLDMVKFNSRGFRQASQGTDLINAVFEDLLLGLSEFAPAEMLAIREAGMGADPHLIVRRRLNRSPSRGRIACVKAAGNISRGDERHELFIHAAPFPQITVQVDFHNRHYKVDEQ